MKPMTYFDAWKLGDITGLFCLTHDTFSHSGTNLSEKYFDDHRDCRRVRIDATSENCGGCKNSAASLFLMQDNKYFCLECIRTRGVAATQFAKVKQMTEQLQSCPFCGAAPRIYQTEYRIKCTNGPCVGPQVSSNDLDVAVSRWNQRPVCAVHSWNEANENNGDYVCTICGFQQPTNQIAQEYSGFGLVGANCSGTIKKSPFCCSNAGGKGLWQGVCQAHCDCHAKVLKDVD